MIYTATVSTKGQLTIPLELRRKLGILAGTKVQIATQGDTATISIHQLPSLQSAYGSLHRPGMKYVPYRIAREKAGEALGVKYGLTKPSKTK